MSSNESRSSDPHAAGAPADRGRLLFIDDEHLITTLAQRTLQKSWEVTCVPSATEALGLVDTREFDVVACDLMMPGMNGMAFAEELEFRNPALRAKTLFLTGGAVTAEAEAFLARPDVRFMSKPLSMKDLDAALRRLAGRE